MSKKELLEQLNKLYKETEEEWFKLHKKHDGEWHSYNPTDEPFFRMKTLKEIIYLANELD